MQDGEDNDKSGEAADGERIDESARRSAENVEEADDVRIDEFARRRHESSDEEYPDEADTEQIAASSERQPVGPLQYCSLLLFVLHVLFGAATIVVMHIANNGNNVQQQNVRLCSACCRHLIFTVSDNFSDACALCNQNFADWDCLPCFTC